MEFIHTPLGSRIQVVAIQYWKRKDILIPRDTKTTMAVVLHLLGDDL